MCGFIGVLGSVSRSDLEAMLGAVAHRGPDAAALLSDPATGTHFGHRRLAVLDLSPAANQPMRSTDGQLTIVFNGEIYNSPELRRELSLANARFHTDHSDTETILEAYRAWGPACVERFRGMFSFALYDRTTDTIFLARDHFGQKPLYYWPGADTFAFASELRALAHLPQLRLEVDPLALAKFFAHDCIPAPMTLFKGVFKLRPGEWITFDRRAQKLIQKTYWRPEFHRRPGPAVRAEELADRVRKAVARTLYADVPVTALLSGGVDSTLVTMYAKESAHALTSHSIAFSDARYDETADARLAAAFLGTAHTVHPMREMTLADLAATVAKLDEPLGDTGLLPYAHLAAEVAKVSKVAIGGDGGDELFFGYEPVTAFKLLRTLPSPLRRFSHAIVANFPAGTRNVSLDLKLKRLFSAGAAPTSHWAALWMSSASVANLGDVLRSDVTAEEVFSEAIAAFDGTDGDVLDKFNSYFLELYLPSKVLMKVDRASMWQGLEVRSPFLDVDLFSLVAGIDLADLHTGHRAKALLRDKLLAGAPPRLRRKRKQGFGWPVPVTLPRLPSPRFSTAALERMAREQGLGLENHRQFFWNLFVLQNGWYGKYL